LSTELLIFTLLEGKIFNKINAAAKETHDMSVSDSYLSLANYFYQYLTDSTETVEEAVELLGLKRYHLQNGKTLWLCDHHAQDIGAKLADVEKNIASSGSSGEKNQLLEEIRLLEKSEVK
jgi:hypothetical protein